MTYDRPQAVAMAQGGGRLALATPFSVELFSLSPFRSELQFQVLTAVTQLSLSEELLAAGNTFEMSLYRLCNENGSLHVEETCKLSGVRFDRVEVVGGLTYFQTGDILHYYDAERRQIVVVADEVREFFKVKVDGSEVVMAQSPNGETRVLDAYCDVLARF